MQKNEAILAWSELSGARLIDRVKDELGLRTDAAFAAAVQMHTVRVSRTRHGHFPVNARLLLRCHDISGIPIAELRRAARVPGD
jgi:hypothetical protein